ncbi:hypothetical protein DFH08DRAFT_411870 [Mycena albidolilacea]|uniref:Uncharacterized protein n=1 Tax=Mycena albidolilacea TaxID=1033008 RepID=A0AAD7AIT0_9AGAR|nr:hypothetical protein DFH08DRAFT_411870 [Mycena albidolilacea]
MLFPFPSRARRKPPLKPNLLPDVLWTSINALRDSSDAFPPLKSAVGGVIAICTIAERAKHCKTEACAIALRTKEILDLVADAVPDGSTISPPMLLSIGKFTILLDETRRCMEPMTRTGRVSRVVHLNRNERTLQHIKSKLDDAYRDFLAASALRVEVLQTQLAIQQTQLSAQHTAFTMQQTHFAAQQKHTHLQVQMLSIETTRLLFYARVTSFFGRPLMLQYKAHRYPLRPIPTHQ